ncbi:MAG: hypothetical protein Q9M89_09470 [Persephonella sp.]|nr:hypothetical protein [Persephonella sp.]
MGRIVSGIFLFGKELHINFFIENENLKRIIQKDIDTLTEKLIKYSFSNIHTQMLKNPQKKENL